MGLIDITGERRGKLTVLGFDHGAIGNVNVIVEMR